MSTKYSTSEREGRIVRDAHGEIALTDHALHRYRERTPHDCHVDIREAWRNGERIPHPRVVQANGEDEAPHSARVYRHGDAWGVVFLVVENDDEFPDGTPGHQELVVATVCRIQTFDYGPTRAYLHGHGPHKPERDR